jgi:sulfatase modifying factor 1
MRQIASALTALALGATTTVPVGALDLEIVENSIGVQLVRVPAGTFTMGSEEPLPSLAQTFAEADRAALEALRDEAPAHRVRIGRPFLLGRHEVTVAQFRRFVEASGHVVESEADRTGGYGFDPAHDRRTAPRSEVFAGRSPRYSWRDPGFPQGDDHPVVNVTWNDANAMAEWLSRTEGRRYRLPTEAEWEYACRAGTRTRYHSGDDPRSLARVANVFDRETAAIWPHPASVRPAWSDGHAFTAPVGRFAPNAFGLHDMHGNAWEWTADLYGADAYARSPADDPRGPASGDVRVRRGGSWRTEPIYARCAFRNWNTPQTRYPLVGFRLLRELDDGR